MVDIQTVSIAIASASVTMAAIYYIWQIRHQTKVRQTDLVIRLSSDLKTKEFVEAFLDVLEVEFKDYSDFVKNFGMPFSRERVPLSFIMVGNFFENLGVLYSNKLLDASLIIQLFPITLAWEKMKPIIYGLREEYHSPQYYEWFEYLYNEVKQRQQPASQTA